MVIVSSTVLYVSETELVNDSHVETRLHEKLRNNIKNQIFKKLTFLTEIDRRRRRSHRWAPGRRNRSSNLKEKLKITIKYR